jgi:hypothetical protein
VDALTPGGRLAANVHGCGLTTRHFMPDIEAEILAWINRAETPSASFTLNYSFAHLLTFAGLSD